ncbi:MAG: hypothetical protein IPL73_27695 [Candidatus Obscuribacter sp.]|nr:hypothetical protein [Candidatus Obscuribacter sp.]
MSLSTRQIVNAVTQGRKISEAKSRDLELLLENDPANLEYRVIVCSYYWSRGSIKAKYVLSKHSLWLIEHMPEDSATCDPVFYIDKYLCPEPFEVGRRLWDSHLTSRMSPGIVKNAYRYFRIHEPEHSLSILQSGLRAFPGDRALCSALLDEYLYKLRHKSRMDGDSVFDLAIDMRRRLVELSGSVNPYQEIKMAVQAVDLCRYSEAHQHANCVLESINQSDHYQARFVHSAHTVLGLCALQNSDLPGAVKHLESSIKLAVFDEPPNFSPCLHLAGDLLLLRQVEPVVTFLHGCARIQPKMSMKILIWVVQIRFGKRSFPVWNKFEICS